MFEGDTSDLWLHIQFKPAFHALWGSSISRSWLWAPGKKPSTRAVEPVEPETRTSAYDTAAAERCRSVSIKLTRTPPTQSQFGLCGVDGGKPHSGAVGGGGGAERRGQEEFTWKEEFWSEVFYGLFAIMSCLQQQRYITHIDAKPSIPQMQSGSRGSRYSIPYCCLDPGAFGRNSIVNTVDVFCTVRGSTLTENVHSRLSYLSLVVWSYPAVIFFSWELKYHNEKCVQHIFNLLLNNIERLMWPIFT